MFMINTFIQDFFLLVQIFRSLEISCKEIVYSIIITNLITKTLVKSPA